MRLLKRGKGSSRLALPLKKQAQYSEGQKTSYESKELSGEDVRRTEGRSSYAFGEYSAYHYLDLCTRRFQEWTKGKGVRGKINPTKRIASREIPGGPPRRDSKDVRRKHKKKGSEKEKKGMGGPLAGTS